MTALNCLKEKSPEMTCPTGSTAALVFALVAGTISPAAAHADGRFAIYDMKVLDRITEILPSDVNGDGLKDLVVLHTKGYAPEEQRWVSIFWQRSDGAFSSAADFTWRLPASAVAIDVGDVHDDPGEELVLLTPVGASYMAYLDSASGPELVPLVGPVAGSLLPSRERVPWLDFVQDWTGDGRDDVGIISFDKLMIFSGGGVAPYSDPQVIDIDVRVALHVREQNNDESSYRATSATRHYPYFLALDVDADGDKDLVSHWNDQARFYLQNDGEFSRKADAKVGLDLLTDEEKRRRSFDVRVAVTDLDGDGLADVFGGKSTNEGISDYFSAVEVHFGDGTLDFEGDPDWSTAVKGMSSGHWLDLDGDGRKELIMPVVNLGIADIIRILVTKKVKIGFYVYFLGEGRAMSQEPDYVEEVTLGVGFESGAEAQIVDFEGDYNGDGRKDLVVATGKEELSVFLGTVESGRLFSKKPEEKIEVETFGDFKPVDLNSDGKADMILYYRSDPEMISRARIIMNVGEW